MTRKRNCKRLFYVLLTLFMFVVIIIGGRGIFPAFAEPASYSSVIEDLQKDSTFKASVYPDNAKDYSIKVIQVAEGENGELFLYTYQPCQKTKYLVATDINMSLKPDTEIIDSSGSSGNNDNTDNTDNSGNTGNNTDNNNSGLNGDGTGGSTGSGFGGGGGHGRSAESQTAKPYGLKLLSCAGVFAKYLVNDFTVSSSSTRYYNITSIYRKWDNQIDAGTDNGNTITGKYFKVGKCFKVETVNGTVKYSCKDTDVIEIKSPFVDFLSYYKGATWGSVFGLEGDEYTDVHYIAFSTDKKIDTLKEADVTYTTQSYEIKAFGKGMSEGEKSDLQYITLTGEMDISASKYTWNCIQRSEDFIKTTKLNSSTAETVKKSEFVLVFLTTPYTQKEVYSFMQGHGYDVNGTKVSDVAILRLMFETDGVCYNLGALMDKQEGDDNPGNQPDPVSDDDWLQKIIDFFISIWNKIKGFKWWQFLLLGLALIIGIGLIVSFIKWGIKAVITGIARFVWWLVCLPFKAIKALFSGSD